MKIFGTVYPFVETGDASLRLGRHVANYEFLRALLRHGTFDEYHLFCLSVGHLRITRDRILKEDIPDSQKSKVRLFLIHHLIDNLKCNRYHVFHLGGWGYFFPGLVYLRNKHACRRFPITALIHSLNGAETAYHGLKLCTAPLLPFDTVVCSSRAGRSVLEASFRRMCGAMAETGARIAFRGRTEIIPLGVENDFARGVERNNCRERLGLPGKARIILSVGRLSPGTKADPYPPLLSFRMLVNQNPDKELLFIIAGGGSGSEQVLVQAMVREMRLEGMVKILPNFDVSIKRSLYGAADIVLALSDNLQETFGISVIEGMAAGLPVVASDLNGYKELFEHGCEGFKVPTIWLDRLALGELADVMNFETMQLVLAQCMAVDAEAATRFMHTLLNDPSSADRMGHAGRELAKQRYLWSSVIRRYERLWDELAMEAERFTESAPIRQNVLANDYLGNFEHYPTEILTDHHRCSLTPQGQAAMSAESLPSPYADIAPLVEIPRIRKLLRLLNERERTIREIIEEIGSLSGKEDVVRYGLLWAAKYSLIRINA
ncbi:MAG: glycosyltransferase [Chitinivibrionales bacterium]|nr:glycosyltransferase [Chitinivibrionales bacterium]MBD3356187.1 glycosyltransferase [Chitinivibrionales bacterium]